MNEDLKNLQNKLSLTEEEQNDVIVEKAWVGDPADVGKSCLLGKLLLHKGFNVEAMKNVF